MNKKISLLIVASILLATSIKSLSISEVQGQVYNLYINVNVVEPSLNASYTTYPASGAIVTVVYITSGKIDSGTTDPDGWVRFYLVAAGNYVMNISYPKTYYKQKGFYLDPSVKTYFYENVFKFIQFLGEQLVMFRYIQASLPASVTFRFPKSTLINATVESFGLRVKTDKSEEYFTVYPLDVNTPIYNQQGVSVGYSNYTVSLELKTLEAGMMSFTLVDNGTYRVIAEPLFYVSENVVVRIRYILRVVEQALEATLNRIQQQLDLIIALLLEIREVQNKTIVPKLFGLYDYIGQLFNSSIGVTFKDVDMKQMWTKVVEIDTEVRRTRDNLFIFTTGYKNEMLSGLSQYFSEYKTMTYIMTSIIVIGALVVIAGGTRGAKQREKKPETIVVG